MESTTPANLSAQAIQEVLDKLLEKYRKTGLRSYAQVSWMLSFKGKPYSIADFPWMAPLFDVNPPLRSLAKTGRQVSKSSGLGGSDTLDALLRPWTNSLFVAPLFAQAKRINDDVVRMLVRDTPFRGLFDSPACNHGALRHTYKNNSTQVFSYAWNSVDRIRGIAGINRVKIDEVQGMNEDFIPIIEETASIPDFKYFVYSGTPLSKDNIIEKYWERSSQGEPVIKCRHCEKHNVACLSQHALKMISPKGLVCAHCDKELRTSADDPSRRFYEHGIPDRIRTFRGLHVPQIILPAHYRRKKSWEVLLNKQQNYGAVQFQNEVMGESADSARAPITATDLNGACHPSTDNGEVWNNTLKHAMERRKEYALCLLGIDWSGGGDNGSTTVVSFIGVTAKDGKQVLEIPYIKRISVDVSEIDELTQVLQIWAALRPDYIAHDYGNAGGSKETLLINSFGFPSNKLVPIQYTGNSTGKIIYYRKGNEGRRASYVMDKSRSLHYLFTLIRQKLVKFPQNRYCSELLQDFLELREERIESPLKNDCAIFGRRGTKPDDTAHSVNFGCAALMYLTGTYPQMFEEDPGGPSVQEYSLLMDPMEPNWGV